MRYIMTLVLSWMVVSCVQTSTAPSLTSSAALNDEEKISVNCQLETQPEYKDRIAADFKKWGFDVTGADVDIAQERVAMKLFRSQKGKPIDAWSYKNMELDETTDGIGRVNFGFGTTGKERNRSSFGATLQRYPEGTYALLMRLEDTPLKFRCASKPTAM